MAAQMDWVLASGVAAGIAGMLAHLADVFTCYNAREVLDGVLNVPSDILDLDKSALMMAEKTITELALGHIFALTFIPAGFIGSYFFFHAIREKFDYLRWPFVAVLFVFYSLGALMHCSFTFVGLMARQKDFEGSDLSVTVRPFFEVICNLVGERLMLPGNVAVFSLLLLKGTILPRWTCLFCPGALQLYVALFASYAPLGLRIYLLVTIYNMSSGIWWLVMSLAYWRQRRGALGAATDGPTLLRTAKSQKVSPAKKQ
eukprot:TRINITY_DN43487_c0_g1_i1.p1 TRINITY_DN43487_c0_g1~~TRINITY_DN43487_c0_g1_i1.p1  ORF type:complete len:258 (-),score=44.81 TRINITY_DN43487_c0_g1_i1:316-1089(-)